MTCQAMRRHDRLRKPRRNALTLIHDGCMSGHLLNSTVSVHKAGGEVEDELIGPQPSVHGLMT